jgi:heme/copper-type cytochrome/quinol oxidase subunit 3
MSEVTRSMEAKGSGAAAAVERQRRAQPSGWWGALLLIASETALFGCLIATYFYLRFKSGTWPPDGIEKPSVVLPLVFTAMLVASCLPVAAAVRAAKGGLTKRAWWLLVLAAAVQATYLGLQINLLVDNLNSFSPRVDAYASAYYALLGLHHAHVAIGLGFDLWVLAALARGLTNYRLTAVRILGLYWYFVSAMAVLIVLTQLYPSL